MKNLSIRVGGLHCFVLWKQAESAHKSFDNSGKDHFVIWTNVVFNSDKMIRVGLFHCVVLCCMGNFADFTKSAAKWTHGVMEDISPFPHFSYFGNFEICYVLCKSALN